jgi:SagB-type dehydrogenase family enzyme
METVTAFIFTGPTLSAADGRIELQAHYLPPVAQGDVYRVAQARPKAIGIIDGYFERLPAVWHKEILWAMLEGIHVFGSASMGALRAAELAPFGMEGVGTIFEFYRDGILEADDEVAVAHGPAERGYAVSSEAMVNIRQTLAHAADSGIISAAAGEALIRIAKELYYPRRIYPLILQIGKEQGLPLHEIDALRAWLPAGQINQKRLDALRMLREMRECLNSSASPKRVLYTFEHTEFWERARYSAGQMRTDPGAEIEMVDLDALRDELALNPEAQARATQGNLLRLFAVETAKRAGTPVAKVALQETLETFRRERELFEPDAMESWLTTNQVSREHFQRLIEDEARIRWAMTWAEPHMNGRLADYLRVTGEYSRLLARASHKRSILKSQGLMDVDPSAGPLTSSELVQWYFERCVGRPAPTDIAQHVHTSGFIDEVSFRRAIFREFCYRHPQFGSGEASPCPDAGTAAGRGAEHQAIALPDRFQPTPLSFEQIIESRRSSRQFSSKAIQLDTFAKILSFGDGLARGSDGHAMVRRTAPSAGSLYPVDLYCFARALGGIERGIYLYDPPTNSLLTRAANEYTATLKEIVPESDFVVQAAACICLVVSLGRLKVKYGDRAYRFALLEAGHIAQNLLLGAAGEGVAALPVGGFVDDKLNGLLGLDGKQEFAVYLIFLGASPEPTGNPSGSQPESHAGRGRVQ